MNDKTTSPNSERNLYLLLIEVELLLFQYWSNKNKPEKNPWTFEQDF
jgi:hypothetical protein